MLNTDETNTGYVHGLEDARKKNPQKRYRFKGLSWKYWLNFNHATNTYIEGYDAGFMDGLREKNIIHQTQNIENKDTAFKNTENKTNIINKEMPNEVYYCKNCRQQQSIYDGEFCKSCGKLTVSWYTDTEKEDDAIRKWDNINGTNIINQIPIYTNNSNLLTNNSKIMASSQQLQLQLQQLQAMESFLMQLNQIIEQNIKTYKDKMKLLRQSGMPVEVCDTYEGKYQNPKTSQLTKIQQEIAQADIPYIKRNIVQMEQALMTAKKG